ncbi:MAG TPA: phosphoethanolamine transferase [Leptospiraceae bacterium]|nr:phosphoethanolamine transferase [Leptospiraceae bacterium]
MKVLKKLILILFLPLLVLSVDFYFRIDTILQFNEKMRGYYLLSILASFLLYIFLFLFTSQISKRISTWISYLLYTVIGFIYTFSIVGSYGYYQKANMLPNYFVIHYMIQEPLNSFTLLKDSFTFGSVITFLGLFIFSVALLSVFSRITETFNRLGKIFISILGIIVLSLITIISFNTRFQDQLYVSDINTIAFISRNIANRVISNQMGSTGLQSRTKISIKEKFPNSKMNLILVVAESLRRDHLSLYGYSRDTTPFLKKYAKEKNQEFVVFQNAYSNASSTLISLPSILTGVSPIQSAADTHSYPLFWEYGKESGKKTFYITSHSLAWNNLGGYFANGGIDYQFNRENSNEPIFNDIGIDDRKTLAAFDKHIRKLSEENKNFSGLLHLNTNHFPFFVPSSSKVWQGNDVKDMYDNSVYHFDKLIESMFQTLKDTNNLENTIVIITSDHGESLLEHNYLGHIESYYLETVSIPMMVYFPKKLQTYDTFHNLQSNANKNVMNLDIIPTIVHLLNKSLDSFHTVSFVGKSLMDSIDPDRVIVISNNNEISLYRVGISFIENNLHYIAKINSIPKQEELYNIKEDSTERKNLWSSIDSNQKHKLRDRLKDCVVCSEIFSNLQIEPPSVKVSNHCGFRNWLF